MNRILELSVTGTAIALIATAPFACHKPLQTTEPEKTVLTISAPAEVHNGQSFSVNILVTPGQVIAGLQCDLNFDGSLFSATRVTEGDLLRQSGAATYFNPGNIEGAAVVGITGAIMTSGNGVSAPGTFVTIEFTSGIAEGAGSFTLSGVIIGDVNSLPVIFKLSDARVAVVRQSG